MLKSLARFLVCTPLSLLPVGFARAADVPTATPTPPVQATWPKEVVVTVGDVRTRIDGPKLWTLSGVDYQGKPMATTESAYGAVFTIRGVGHLGTAHFLDVPGAKGQVEKELVTKMDLFLDGVPVSDLKPTMKLNGDAFRMERESIIRSMALKSTVQLEDGVLIETQHIRTTKPVDLQKAHPFMYAFTPEAAVYVWGNDGGVLSRGAFLKEGKTDVKTIKDAKWVAVFNPATGTGSVLTYLKHPADADAWFLLIDAPGVYRKVAAMSFVDKVMPEGFDGTYRSAVGFFTATEKDWETTAATRAAQLKSAGEKLEQ